MTALFASLITLGVTTLIGIILGVVKYYLNKQLEEVRVLSVKAHDLELRLTSIETTFAVLGNINETLVCIREDLKEVKTKVSYLEQNYN